jgi:choice-of-anchor C domain-containing protein
MRWSAIVGVAFSAVLLASPFTFGQQDGKNLLVNGSFEEGPEVPGKKGFKPLDKGSTEIKGWTVIKGQIDYVKGFYAAADGKACLDLHGSPGYGGVEQTFATVKGNKYRVTFSLAATPGFGPQQVGVEAAHEKKSFMVMVVAKKGAKPVWETRTLDFVADADKTTLRIYTLETKKNPKDGPLLDQVSVVQRGK